MVNLPKAFRPPALALTKTTRRQQQIESDARRGSAAERGYDARWAEASRAFRREHPLCCCCLANGCVSAAQLTDHIVPHKGSETVFWDHGNWQALCHRCHNEIKATIEVAWLRGQCSAAALRLDRLLPEYFG